MTKNLSLWKKWTTKIKSYWKKHSDAELERILEKKEKEITTRLVEKLNLEVKIYEVVYKDHTDVKHKLELDIVSLTEGLFQHCNAKEDFSSILMIREKRND